MRGDDGAQIGASGGCESVVMGAHVREPSSLLRHSDIRGGAGMPRSKKQAFAHSSYPDLHAVYPAVVILNYRAPVRHTFVTFTHQTCIRTPTN